MTKPILKWAGGKRQLLSELRERLPETYDQYYEPFFGGGALFFDLEPESGSINDINPRLMNFYQVVRDSPEELIEVLESFQHPETDPDPYRRYSNVSETGKEITEYYYQQRALFNLRPYQNTYDSVKEAALLLYLNRTCYNGLYRENQSGGFNSPIGDYENPDWVMENRIYNVSETLQDVRVNNIDYQTHVLEHATEGDLVYFDPPYKPMSPTESFTEYSKDGFGQDEQMELLSLAQELTDNGVYVLMSNSGIMEPQYDQYFEVDLVDASRSINSDGDNRGSVKELIATNYSIIDAK